MISHLPNLRYLSGLEATAGQGLLTAAGHLYLLVDPRYEAAAGERRDDVGVDVLTAVRTSEIRPSAWIAAQCVRAGIASLAFESRVMTLHDAGLVQRALAGEPWCLVDLEAEPVSRAVSECLPEARGLEHLPGGAIDIGR